MEVKNLDIDAKEYLFGSLFLLANKLQILGDNYLEEITLKQWFLLMMIENLDRKQSSITEVAAHIGSSRQNVRKMLEILEAKGYVELSQNLHDKRNLSVELTPQSFQFFENFETKGAIFLDRLFQDISSEQMEISRKTFETLFENIKRMELYNE